MTRLDQLHIMPISCAAAQRVKHSVPTRRSSDLQGDPQPRVGADVVQPALQVRPGLDRALGYDRREQTQRVEKLGGGAALDRKSTRLNSSHLVISYAVLCLKKRKNTL